MSPGERLPRELPVDLGLEHDGTARQTGGEKTRQTQNAGAPDYDHVVSTRAHAAWRRNAGPIMRYLPRRALPSGWHPNDPYAVHLFRGRPGSTPPSRHHGDAITTLDEGRTEAPNVCLAPSENGIERLGEEEDPQRVPSRERSRADEAPVAATRVGEALPAPRLINPSAAAPPTLVPARGSRRSSSLGSRGTSAPGSRP